MPFYLKASEIDDQLAGMNSLLIVPCRFCPAASLAVYEKKPFIELFRHFFRTEAYESFIQSLRVDLEAQGIDADVFNSWMPHHYVACMWSTKRRKALVKRAKEFDGIVVLGCEAAVETVRDAIGPGSCRVIQGMEVVGLMNLLPKFIFPSTVSLEVQSMTMHRTGGNQKTLRSPHLHTLIDIQPSKTQKIVEKREGSENFRCEHVRSS